MHDPRIMAIVLQHFTAESKEGTGRNTVIFEDDCLVNLLEQPVDAAAHAHLAAHIDFSIVSLDFAGPIYRLNDPPSRFTSFLIRNVTSRGPSAITNRQALAFSARIASRNLGSCIRPVEYDKGYRGHAVHRSAIMERSNRSRVDIILSTTEVSSLKRMSIGTTR